MLRAGLIVAVLATQPVIAEELRLDTQQSLSSLEYSLSELEAPRGVDHFARGAVSFLRAIELSLQERYRTNAAIGYEMIGIPVLRLPVPPNPEPEPFEPSFVTSLFVEIDAAMERARENLSRAALQPDDKLILDVGTLWFDVDGDGSRDPGESALKVVGAAVGNFAMGSGADVPAEGLVVHFDAADVEWLAAYTHLLSAFSEVVLAFDPTEVITDIIASNAAMAEVKGGLPQEYGWFTGQEAFVDAIATVYGALNRVPTRENTEAARAHLLEMIERNRLFWARVAEETDNSLEWIPNASQDAALGFELPAETGEIWLGVLADAKAVLTGELLIPHWRTAPGGGVNVARMFADPPAFDIVTWVQGVGLAPYMEPGPLVSGESYARFRAMFYGDAVLFMVLLN